MATGTRDSKFTWFYALAGSFVVAAMVALLATACARRATPDARGRPEAMSGDPASPAKGTSMARRAYPKPTDSELRQRLSPLEYEVTQHEATEPAFRNRFWNNHEAGLYVDIVSGEPLFSSTDKFDSGTGWPSFTKPVEAERVVSRTDSSHGMSRTEVRSRSAESHLGHVFDDGPAPAHTRYCINSASLRFIPVNQLEKEGYGAYLPVFGQAAPKAATAQMSSAAAANSCVAPAPGEQPGCQATIEEAVLAGGCFWGMEEILRKIPGVLQTEVGYTGGTTASPTYDDVHTGRTGHTEAVRILFDPKKITYEELLDKWFFRMHDPTTQNRQGNDRGTQYRSAIFVTSPEQRKVAESVKRRVGASGRWKAPIVTEIAEAGPFTLAEVEHQKYLEKHPGGYSCHYLRE